MQPSEPNSKNQSGPQIDLVKKTSVASDFLAAIGATSGKSAKDKAGSKSARNNKQVTTTENDDSSPSSGGQSAYSGTS